MNLNQTDEFIGVVLSPKAIVVGIGLNIALLALELTLGAFLLSFLWSFWIPPPELAIAISICFFVIPGIGMVLCGFVTAHLAKNSIYSNCVMLGLTSPFFLTLSFCIVSKVITGSSPNLAVLNDPMVVGFLFMHFPTMIFGGFVYKKYFKVSTLSNRVHSELANEYLD